MRKCEDCGTEMIPMVLPGSMFCPNDCDRKDKKEAAKTKEDDALFVPPNWAAIGLPAPAVWYSTQTVGTGSIFSGIGSNGTTTATTTNVPWWGAYGGTGSLDDAIDTLFGLDTETSTLKTNVVQLRSAGYIYAPYIPVIYMEPIKNEFSLEERITRYATSAIRRDYYGILGLIDSDEEIEVHESLGPTRIPRRDRS